MLFYDVPEPCTTLITDKKGSWRPVCFYSDSYFWKHVVLKMNILSIWPEFSFFLHDSEVSWESGHGEWAAISSGDIQGTSRHGHTGNWMSLQSRGGGAALFPASTLFRHLPSLFWSSRPPPPILLGRGLPPGKSSPRQGLIFPGEVEQQHRSTEWEKNWNPHLIASNCVLGFSSLTCHPISHLFHFSKFKLGSYWIPIIKVPFFKSRLSSLSLFVSLSLHIWGNKSFSFHIFFFRTGLESPCCAIGEGHKNSLACQQGFMMASFPQRTSITSLYNGMMAHQVPLACSKKGYFSPSVSINLVQLAIIA